MLEKLQDAFLHAYSRAPTAISRAPGRVNLIGEHTDYNEGFVLPCAIDYATWVAVAPRDDSCFRLLALDCDSQTDSFDAAEPIAFREDRMWCNYVRGVVNELLQRGYELRGCDIAITGNVPLGAGLSSSASLEVAVAAAVTSRAGHSLPNLELAQVGQVAENDFVGCACGIMDQLISAAGISGHAVAIDCRSHQLTPVVVPEQLSILIINSNVQRGLVDSEYNSRRRQCEAAARHFGVASLRDVSLERFNADAGELDPIIARRARHVLEENRRTLDAVQALGDNDIARLSELMAASHCSMKTLFEITVPQIDYLVDTIAAHLGERGGVRMTGGGFGGCVVALLPNALVPEVLALVKAGYQRHTGLREAIYRSRPAQGVELIRPSVV